MKAFPSGFALDQRAISANYFSDARSDRALGARSVDTERRGARGAEELAEVRGTLRDVA